MSRLAEKMRRVAREAASGGRSIGFGAGGASGAGPSLLLLARLSSAVAAAAPAAALSPVDAILLSAWEKGLEERAQGWQGPWGVAAPTVDPASAARFREMGADFLLLGAEAQAAVLQGQDLGFLLAVEEAMSDSLLRAVGELPLDGLLVELLPGELTLGRQLALRRLALLGRHHLLVALAAAPSPGELEALREAGVAGLALLVERKAALGGLEALRRAIDGLPPRRPRREERPSPILPLPLSPGDEEEMEEFPPP